MVATKPWTMQLARAAARLMAAALRGSPVAFGAAFGTGFGAGFATATGVMFLDDDVQRLEIFAASATSTSWTAARAAEARARRRARTCSRPAASCLAGAGVLLWRARRRHRARRRPRDAPKTTMETLALATRAPPRRRPLRVAGRVPRRVLISRAATTRTSRGPPRVLSVSPAIAQRTKIDGSPRCGPSVVRERLTPVIISPDFAIPVYKLATCGDTRI